MNKKELKPEEYEPMRVNRFIMKLSIKTDNKVIEIPPWAIESVKIFSYKEGDIYKISILQLIAIHQLNMDLVEKDVIFSYSYLDPIGVAVYEKKDIKGKIKKASSELNMTFDTITTIKLKIFVAK